MAADFLPIPSTPPPPPPSHRRPAAAPPPCRSPPPQVAAAAGRRRPVRHPLTSAPRSLPAISTQSHRNLPSISPQSPRDLPAISPPSPPPRSLPATPPYSPPLSLAPVLAARASTALTAARGISKISLAPRARCSTRRSMYRASHRLGSMWAVSSAPSAGTRKTCGCSLAVICMQEPPRHGT